MKNGVKNYVGSLALGALLSISPLFLQAQKEKGEKQNEKVLFIKDIQILEDSIAGMREAMTGILNDPDYIRWETQFRLNTKLVKHTLPDLRRNDPQNYTQVRYMKDSIGSSHAIQQAQEQLSSYNPALEYFRVSIQSLEKEIDGYRKILSEKFPSPEEKRRKNMAEKHARRWYASQKRYAGKFE